MLWSLGVCAWPALYSFHANSCFSVVKVRISLGVVKVLEFQSLGTSSVKWPVVQKNGAQWKCFFSPNKFRLWNIIQSFFFIYFYTFYFIPLMAKPNCSFFCCFVQTVMIFCCWLRVPTQFGEVWNLIWIICRSGRVLKKESRIWKNISISWLLVFYNRKL